MSIDRKEVVLKLAEVALREEKRRARDMAAAIDDYETAPEAEKAQEALNLVFAARHTQERFGVGMTRGLGKAIEAVTGKSIEDMVADGIEHGDEGLAFAFGPNGLEIEHLADDGEGNLVPSDRDDPDTTAVGDPVIPGITLEGSATEKNPATYEFALGDRVRHKASPENRGIVIAKVEREGNEVRWTDGPMSDAEPPVTLESADAIEFVQGGESVSL